MIKGKTTWQSTHALQNPTAPKTTSNDAQELNSIRLESIMFCISEFQASDMTIVSIASISGEPAKSDTITRQWSRSHSNRRGKDKFTSKSMGLDFRWFMLLILFTFLLDLDASTVISFSSCAIEPVWQSTTDMLDQRFRPQRPLGLLSCTCGQPQDTKVSMKKVANHAVVRCLDSASGYHYAWWLQTTAMVNCSWLWVPPLFPCWSLCYE